MKNLLYITKRSFCNRLQKALKRPVTYLFLIGIVAYIVFIGFSLLMLVKEVHFNTVRGLIVVMTALVFLAFPASYWMYIRRKGIIFKPAHTHFVFQAPISPKKILLYGALKNMLGDVGFGLAFLVTGMLFFEVSFSKMLLVFLAWVIVTVVQESGMILLLYGNDRVSEENTGWVGKVFLVLYVAVFAFLAWFFWKYGLTLQSVMKLVDFPALRLVPVIGWNIALFRLILLGTDLANLLGAVLCMIFTVLSAVIIWKIPCKGGYFEEAAKFADDYQKMRERKNKGETGSGKEKYRKIHVKFRANGARAIFYRQLLEYRKARFFIFNQMNVICFLLAFILAYAWKSEADYNGLILLGILAYVVFCTSGYVGKWEKELENPYLYLIPEKPVVKMWYATQMEHIKSLIDGTVMCVVIGIAWHIPVWQIPCSILIYVLFQAEKMYMRILALYVLGDHFGTQARMVLRMFIQSSVMGIGVAIAAVLGMAINLNLAFPILLVYNVIVTIVVMFLASSRFEVLEQLE